MPDERNSDYRSDLRGLLVEYFSVDELRTLCFDEHIRYEDLPGQEISAKAREIVKYFERREELPRLLNWIEQERPNLKDRVQRVRIACLSAQVQTAQENADWEKVLVLCHEIQELDAGNHDAKIWIEEAEGVIHLAALYSELRIAYERAEWEKVLARGRDIEEIYPNYRDVQERVEQAEREIRMAKLYSGLRIAYEGAQWEKVLELGCEIEELDTGYRDVQARTNEARSSLRREKLQRILPLLLLALLVGGTVLGIILILPPIKPPPQCSELYVETFTVDGQEIEAATEYMVAVTGDERTELIISPDVIHHPAECEPKLIFRWIRINNEGELPLADQIDFPQVAYLSPPSGDSEILHVYIQDEVTQTEVSSFLILESVRQEE